MSFSDINFSFPFFSEFLIFTNSYDRINEGRLIGVLLYTSLINQDILHAQVSTTYFIFHKRPRLNVTARFIREGYLCNMRFKIYRIQVRNTKYICQTIEFEEVHRNIFTLLRKKTPTKLYHGIKFINYLKQVPFYNV